VLLIADYDVDLAILDINMPVMDGIQDAYSKPLSAQVLRAAVQEHLS